jgi:hypothetical protein
VESQSGRPRKGDAELRGRARARATEIEGRELGRSKTREQDGSYTDTLGTGQLGPAWAGPATAC